MTERECRLLGGVLITVQYHDRGSVPCQCRRRGSAQAAAAACHHGHLFPSGRTSSSGPPRHSSIIIIMKSGTRRTGGQHVRTSDSCAASAGAAGPVSPELLLALRDRPSALLGPEALVALPPTAGGERAGRRRSSGPEAARALAGDRREFGEWRPVFLAAHGNRVYGEFLELNPADGSPRTSASAMAVVSPGPSVFRLTLFRHAHVPDQPPARGGRPRLGRDRPRIALRYLQELEAGRAASAAACFADRRGLQHPSARRELGPHHRAGPHRH